MISPLLRRYTWNSAWLYNVRIFIALCGTTLFPWWIGEVKLTIPLTLGVVAAALTDLDDRLAGRLRNLAITLVCFFIASASVELLFPWPPLFALGLTVSTIGFILLGGLGQRYATIAFGALLIAIYTMLGVTLYDHWYLQPLFLLAGAVWYNLLTLSGHLIFPIRPLQDNLARSYEQLARYLELKSRLFDPDLEDESQAPLYDLALANGQLVATLNQTKVSLLTRLRGDRGQRGTRRTLQYYFVAQDIHERASSSHIQYQTLRDQFRYSDVMFRFQRMLSMQAQACQKLSRAILLREPYQHDAHFERAFMHLDAALERVRAGGASDEQLNALGYLLNNLRAIDAQLATIESVQTTAPAGSNTETLLADDRLGGLNDIWLRLQRNMSPESALFRHAMRMSLVLCAGYAFIQFTGLQHGYWILLTSLFVCQPNYNATRHRLALRIIGTLVGVAIGLPVLLLVPSVEGQLLLIVLTGVLFFAFRNVQYAHATMFITLLVLLCFNLLGEGFEVALPRIIDTLIGCAIAWAAVSFIWPDWKFRNLPRVLDRAMNANCRYLDAILEQYHQAATTGWPTVSHAVTPTTAMLSWLPSSRTCRRNHGRMPHSARPPFACCVSIIPSPATSPPSARIGKNCPRRTSSPCWMMRSAMWMTPYIIPQRMNSECRRRWPACKTGSTIWSRARTVKSPLCYNRLACCWRCCLKSAACSSGYTLKRNNRCPLAGSRPFQKLLTPWRRERGGMDANDSPLQRQQDVV